ncbi:tRNA modification GTPase TrmE [Treponema primitia ZAS-2]|uniref:tRNA modification GTPase MnmE n=1 Tax=Treponema primitia (strain ATCC BAA-887 / DSM 12427 / ZAS-2) TaxID=545694 RepID=F5YHC3_TREPZ|nr:tRNA uridine-5-carboxymethylaminomethyl(34) synthesis GTPase MnmE [Treponema primitia]AEF86653.1 tRNA modification GTPase TrmE [Treponema primitia ZAS-2]
MALHSAEYGDTDPMAALATLLGESALAIIRTSGKNSLELLAEVFSRPEKLLAAPGNSVVHGWIIGKDRSKIDDVLISIYRAPVTYTGEDSADISCHGGIAAAKAVLETLYSAGFRPSLHGEFTFRAFMNGKLDLTRAESVMELVSAKTGRAREHAVQRLSGTLAEEISGVKELLVQVLAGTELYLDYSEDDGLSLAADPSDAAEAAGLLPDRPLAEEALKRLQTLAESYRRERLYAEGALAVIAGRPNAGKSSLFNLLLKEDRSIVTDIPGTTRDWIEAWVSIEGIPVRLADTAGLHASEDPVEKLGIERSRTLLEEADLILYLIDGAEGITTEDHEFFTNLADSNINTTQIVLLWNKADLVSVPEKILPQLTTESPVQALPPDIPAPLPVSARTGVGIPELTREIAARLEQASGDGSREVSAGLGTARQKELVDSAAASLNEALTLAAAGEPLDIIAPLLREGVNALGEITGEVSTADILETMFSRFCIGK